MKTSLKVKGGMKSPKKNKNVTKRKISTKKGIERLYVSVGSPFGKINFHQAKQIFVYFVLFVAYNLGFMGLAQLNVINFGDWEWLRQGLIFGLTIFTKKLGQDTSNIFLVKK